MFKKIFLLVLTLTFSSLTFGVVKNKATSLASNIGGFATKHSNVNSIDSEAAEACDAPYFCGRFKSLEEKHKACMALCMTRDNTGGLCAASNSNFCRKIKLQVAAMQ